MIRELTCREFVEFLDDYLAGDLPPAEVERFDTHLSCCPSCVAYMKSYQATVELARAAMLEDEQSALPEDVPEDLILAILAARATGSEEA